MGSDSPRSSLVGRRLGPYQVQSLLGAGGMGEVYRARDTRLGRDVALKVLPSRFTSDPERLARLNSEARALAALNDPHIAAIYGLEDARPSGDGSEPAVRALVLELVEGETLEDRIRGARGGRGAGLPLDDTLALARQIADALDTAHEKGIIHRDLKPANIKVRPDGTAKVLDFGLAKALEEADHLLDGSTITSPPMTQAGMVLGTPAYMSPEQARGQRVDTRTDIWAFGCVLFEMLTGRAPFARQTGSDSVAAILEREPEWSLLPANVPASIRRLLTRCLVKDERRRLRNIGDARLDIEEAITPPVASESADGARTMPSSWPWVVALVATGVAIALALSTWQSRGATVEPSASLPVRFVINAPDGEALDVNRSPVGISPDGRSIAFASVRGNTQRIYVRDLDSLDGVALPGSEGGFAPFFSPDGQWIGFFSNQKIRKVLRSGGASIAIADYRELAGNQGISASWADEDTILFTPDVSSGIWRVSSSGGPPAEVTKLGPQETFHVGPQLLPGGRALLFSAVTGGGDPQAFVQRLDNGERTPLVRGHGTRYVPSGHLVFVQGDTLMAVPFDLTRLATAGSPVGVVSNVVPPFRQRTMVTGFNGLFSVSATGTLALLAAELPPQHTLVWVDRAGNEVPISATRGSYAQPRLTPDGQRIAVAVRGSDLDDLWVYELTRDTWDRVTFEGNNGFPLWSRDGTRLTYNTDRSGAVAIEWKRRDGVGSPETLVQSTFAPRVFPFSWSPDGALAFVALRPQQDIYMVRPGSDPTPFVATPSFEGGPAFSPDGRVVAYVSNESGRNEIQLRSFPGSGDKVTVSKEGGNEPVWASGGRELFYRAGDALMAVDVTTSPELRIGAPRRLFSKSYETSAALYANYDARSDGQRFVMVKRMDERVMPPQIRVTMNWLDEVKRLAPAR